MVQWCNQRRVFIFQLSLLRPPHPIPWISSAVGRRTWHITQMDHDGSKYRMFESWCKCNYTECDVYVDVCKHCLSLANWGRGERFWDIVAFLGLSVHWALDCFAIDFGAEIKWCFRYSALLLAFEHRRKENKYEHMRVCSWHDLEKMCFHQHSSYSILELISAVQTLWTWGLASKDS